MRTQLSSLSLLLLPFVLLAGCQRNAGQPARANDAIAVRPAPSVLAVPVEVRMGDLSRLLERELPRVMWRIDKPGQTCAASRRIDLGIAKVKTPTIKCRIIGTVTRGAIRIAGAGKTIRATIPLRATVRAQDIGGLLHETAEARAIAHAVIALTLARDWTPRGTIRLDYDWTDAPHVDLLGQRIDLTEPADRKLAPVIARLERALPGELGRLGVRQAVEQAWASAFATVSLNARDPAVWMRITPRALQFGGYEVAGETLRLRLGMRGLTETHIGRRPAPPPPTPLPPLEPLAETPGDLSFFVSVFADYAVLQPVLLRALRKREARPFDVPGLDPVRAHFERAMIYGTTGGRIAVGLTFTAAEQGGGKPARGTVWMTGKPVTAPNSRRVGFRDFAVSGTTDMEGGSLVLKLANAPGVAPMIAGLLVQNFERDYVELIGKIDRAIAEKRTGRLLIRADLREARTGQLQAAGAGLYLPVWAKGTASILVRPQ
ncbi:hypothetical protein GCM10011380_33350 [Sphingomonas metalli]|uniref:DUF4403 family protein n=1 Tax=Sphingomonas metalli TaxID=1779358 RepID=A0A916TE95_9SPHN|nr:DUF4403 family protein [Sphingomonas metalli]GGB41206.1 hypothetical protein GCM10011380_33350 [Sphingomonas metalli]